MFLRFAEKLQLELITIAGSPNDCEEAYQQKTLEKREWFDLVILKIFSNLNDSMILLFYVLGETSDTDK